MSRLSFRQRDALPSHASYSGEKRSASGGSQPDGEMVTVNALPSSEVGEQPQRKGAVSSTYDSLSWMMGFREKYTLACFWVFGGALLGFCLARSTMLNPSNVRTETTAGEYFWFDRPKWGHNYLIHIYLTIIGGILVGLQGLPGIRRRYMLLHRINGYIVVACLFIGNISGSIIARHAYGGDLNIQMPYYLMGILIVGSGSIGLYNVKRETRRHRAWMLRMVAYFCAPITTKIVMSITREVITKIGNYYAVWRCDEMLYVMKDRAVAESMWPQCFSGVDPGTISIAIRASTKVADAALKKVSLASSTRVSQGMSLWLGLLAHIVGIEIFLRLTDEANQKRYGYVLESNNYDGEAQGEELWVYNK